MPLFKLVARGRRSDRWAIASPLLAVGLTIVVTGLLFLLFGKPPLAALSVFLIQPIASVSGLSELLVKAAPLIMIGVGIALAARATVWNIGAEGQFTMGRFAVAVLPWPVPMRRRPSFIRACC
jgi:simple sugar transport system permease protein